MVGAESARQKGSVLRDIAGMLRSFNYARHQALAHAITERPDALASLAEPVALWERAAPTSLLVWAGPVSNDPVALGFKQTIAANDPLRTGSYSKTLTFTLSTTTP